MMRFSTSTLFLSLALLLFAPTLQSLPGAPIAARDTRRRRYRAGEAFRAKATTCEQRHGSGICPVCGECVAKDAWLPKTMPGATGEPHKTRSNALCPHCQAFERHRVAALVERNVPTLFPRWHGRKYRHASLASDQATGGVSETHSEMVTETITSPLGQETSSSSASHDTSIADRYRTAKVRPSDGENSDTTHTRESGYYSVHHSAKCSLQLLVCSHKCSNTSA